MQAMLLERLGDIHADSVPLRRADVPEPDIRDDEVLLQVLACGVCHTELDEIEGRTPPPRLPIIPGHQVVGRVVALGAGVRQWKPGDRAGVAWIIGACGKCPFCLTDRENLCPLFQATGRDRDGGYAQYMSAPAAFLFRIPNVFTDVEARAILRGCNRLSLAAADEPGRRPAAGIDRIWRTARLVLKLTKWRFPTPRSMFCPQPSEREGPELGAVWTGDTTQVAMLDAILDTTPLDPSSRPSKTSPGGRLVINAIRKEHRPIRAGHAGLPAPRLEKEINRGQRHPATSAS
jgi:propanol-preferring alcohol dehydrogenase